MTRVLTVSILIALAAAMSLGALHGDVVPAAKAFVPTGTPTFSDPLVFTNRYFPFQPGGGTGDPVFDNWPVRTVDAQDLTAILASWRLSVDGMIDAPGTYSFGELGSLPRQDQVTDFHCVEGWSVHDVPWNGVRLATVLELAEVRSAATHVTFHTIGGKYNESLPLAVALEDRTLLAYGVAGSTIPLDNGFPLRLVVPRLLGYKNAKYVDRIELTDRPVEGFWVAAGYDYDGEVPAQRLRPGKY